MQQSQAVVIGMGARAPALEILRFRVQHWQVVEKPKRALISAGQRVMQLGEQIRRKADLERKTGQYLHAKRPIGALEGQHGGLEAWELYTARPQPSHAESRNLIGLFLVSGSGR